MPSGAGPVELGDDLRHDGAARRSDVVRGGRDETARDLVPPVDGVLAPLARHEDGAAVLAREGHDAGPGIALEQPVSERRDAQAGRAGPEDDGLRLRIDELLVGAVDRTERPVGARLEPAVRDDPGDARRRARSERGVAGAGLGVQVRVVRVPLHVPLVEQPLQPGDEVRPVVEEALHLEAVDRDEDRQLRRAGRGGGGFLSRGLRERQEGDDEGDAEGEGGEAEILHFVVGSGPDGRPRVILRRGRGVPVRILRRARDGEPLVRLVPSRPRAEEKARADPEGEWNDEDEACESVDRPEG